MNGPYGPYLQVGMAVEGDKKKPKRVSIPKEIPIASVNIDTANMLLSLPRDLGLHPDTGKKVIANIGRFGPYVNHDAKFKSIPKTESVFSIDLAGAVALLAAANTGPAPILELGAHPSGEGRIEVFAGRYGPYVQHGKIRATLPKSIAPEELTLEEALGLLAEKAAKEEAGGGKKTTARRPAAKKVAAKPAAVKKAPAKKAVPKKTATKKPTVKK
jgi:DNA topoisomerase I